MIGMLLLYCATVFIVLGGFAVMIYYIIRGIYKLIKMIIGKE